MLKVGILYGGRSGEHDVSLCSAASVVSAIDRDKFDVVAIGIDRDGRWYVQDSPKIVKDKDFGKILKLKKTGNWFVNNYEDENKLKFYEMKTGKKVEVDIEFPAVHGTYCEDGTLQGLLELAMVPYVGADVTGSSIGMDKDVAKRLLRDGGIPVVPWITVTKSKWEQFSSEIENKLLSHFDMPVFVKPCCAGSSVGVNKAKAPNQLRESIEFALKYDNKILIEKSIDAREIECSVLGNNDPVASKLGEVIPGHEFYSYEAKYIDSNGADLSIPAEIDGELTDKIRETAVAAYKMLTCCGMARVDFFLDKKDNSFYLNEINTLPGFTSISMYPKLWDISGIPYKELITKLIQLGREKHEERIKIRTAL